MKRVILVDMENMQHQGYRGLENLDDTFEVVFFESEYTVDIPEVQLLAMDQAGVEYSFEWVERNSNGKDTMDFCLIAYLASRSSLAQEENYFILSKDTDFKIPSAYISKKSSIQVKLVKSIDALLNQFEVDYREITPEYLIDLCIQQAKTPHKLHCLLQKTLKKFYTTSEIGYIYRQIVSEFKEVKGL